MKKLVFLIGIVILFSLLFVSGQEMVKILAENEKVVLGVSGCDSGCVINEVRVILEGADGNGRGGVSGYVLERLLRRKFDEGEKGLITPFDDMEIIVEAKCGKGEELDYDILEFYYVNEAGEEILLMIHSRAGKIGENPLEFYERFSKEGIVVENNGKYLREYRLVEEGWPKRWGNMPDKKFDVFPENIDAFFSAGIVDGIMKFRIKKGEKVLGKTDVSVSSCLKIFGSSKAKFKIVTMGDEGMPDEHFLLLRAFDIADRGFGGIAPFSKYEDKFAHYVDLKEVDLSVYERKEKEEFDLDAFENIPSSSSCGDVGRVYNVYDSSESSESIAYSWSGKRVTFLSLDVLLQTVIHEIGHAFCTLEDEYVYKSKVKENGQIIHSYPRKGKNCLVFPGDVKGVDFDFVGCTNPQYFRSTRQSIMNNERYFRKFNVVGCAHCVDAILKEDNKDPEDYFAKCESYNEEVYGNEFNGCVKRLSEEARDCVGEGQNEYCFDCIGEGNEGICSEPQEGRRCQINGVVGECDSGGKCITSIQSGEAEQNFCEDSEEGISLVDKGTVTTDWGVFEDYCEVPGGKYLTELSCGSSEGRVLLASERFDCTLGGAYEDEHGRCIRGVCVWS